MTFVNYEKIRTRNSELKVNNYKPYLPTCMKVVDRDYHFYYNYYSILKFIHNPIVYKNLYTYISIYTSSSFIVANIKILEIMLISQLIKRSKKFFIKLNFRRKYQMSSSGRKFFGKKCN